MPAATCSFAAQCCAGARKSYHSGLGHCAWLYRFAAAVEHGWCTPHHTRPPAHPCDPGVVILALTLSTGASIGARARYEYVLKLNPKSILYAITRATCLVHQSLPFCYSAACAGSQFLQRMVVSACGIVADTGPFPGFNSDLVQSISNENGFKGVAVQLFKLLGMAAGQEEGLKRGAIKAAGQLCDFASPRRAECLEGMSAIAAGESFAKAVAAGACAAAARLQGAVVGPVEGALDLVLTLVEAAAQQGRRPAPKDEDSVVYVAGHNSWLPCSSWVLGAARDIVLE